MRLHVARAGDGDRVALLIHGAMADHGTWHAVRDELVRRGYTVYAPDLRGHGRSGRGHYTPGTFAGDLVESLPVGADVAIGHSLGGLALSLAVDRLRPGRAVYSDPAFALPVLPPEAREAMADHADSASPESIAEENPRWSAADVAAEMAGFAAFDREVGGALADLGGRSFLPDAPVVPSLVQLADPSFVVPPDAATELIRRGFEVVTVGGAGHCIHRDDLAGFMASLAGWI